MSDSSKPFLAIGAGRGGTSLLGACLSGHSNIEMAMELFGWSHLMGCSIAHRQPADIFTDRAKGFREGCLKEIKRHKGKMWGNKLTTEQLFGLEDHNALNPPYQDMLARFFEEAIPEFNVIFIVRDGRACVESKVRRTGQTWEQAAYRWHYSVRVMKAVQALARPVCVVRFEELLRDPQSVAGTMCEYLQLPFESAMLQQTGSTILMPEYRNQAFDQTKLQIPDVPESILAFLKADLEYCGYR